jgi:hypothetical protein
MLTTQTKMDPSEYGTNRNQYVTHCILKVRSAGRPHTQPAKTNVLTFTTTQAHLAVPHCV